MNFAENGAVIKYCKICGKRMEIMNFYEALPRKYCRSCAEDVRRAKMADTMREKRRKARERRELVVKENTALHDENALLRDRVLKLEQTVRRMQHEKATE